MTVDRQHAVGILGHDQPALIEAEHPRRIAVSLRAVKNFRLINFLGEMLPHHRRQFDAHADIDLIVGAGHAVALAPVQENPAPARPTAKTIFSPTTLYCCPR